MKSRILGIRTATSKSGNQGTTLFYESGFSDYERTTADRIEGSKCGHDYVRFDCSGIKVGDVVEFEFGRNEYDGSAVLVGYRKLTPKKD